MMAICLPRREPVLLLGILLLEADLLLELGILDDLVQSRSIVRVQHFQNRENSFLQLIARTSIHLNETTISTSLIP